MYKFYGQLNQDEFLFEGTIRENILFPRPNATEEQLQFAVKSAYVNEFTDRFDDGLDTLIGERGVKLSGGQRQRVGLARALYGDPALVVLDEPNANLDDEGEAALVRAVQAMKAKGKTVVLISHRPGIVGVADRLLILHQGTVQASGPRDGVLAALQKQREAAQAVQASPSAQVAPPGASAANDAPTSN